jgi:hypothetical protein
MLLIFSKNLIKLSERSTHTNPIIRDKARKKIRRAEQKYYIDLALL